MDPGRIEERPNRDLSSEELAALHEIEVGTEWIHRAHGHLLAFHHCVGHGMDHFDVAEADLRTSNHTTLANELRDDILPRGILDDCWTYELVEAFDESMLPAVNEMAQRACEELADGERHVPERRQQRRWRERARRE